MTDINNPCSMCNEQPGIATCSGCSRLFCDDHFVEHRTSIRTEIENLSHQRNTFKEKFDDPEQTNRLRTAWCLEINQWEQSLIKQIQQLAENAREQVGTILQNRVQPFGEEFKQFSDDVQAAQKQKNLVEKDLQKFQSTFDMLQTKYGQVTQLESVKFYHELSDKIEWNSLIYVEDTLTMSQMHVSCSSANIRCPWIGAQEQLEEHLKICNFEPLRKQIQELHVENSRLQESLNQQNIELATANATIKEWESKVDQRDLDIKTLQEQVQNLENQLTQRVQETQNLQDQLNLRGQEIQGLQAQIVQRDQEITNLQSQLSQRDQELQNLQGHLAQHVQEIQNLQGQLAQRVQDMENLQGQLTQRGQEVQSLHGQLALRQQERQTLQTQLAQLCQTVQNLQTEYA